MSREAPSPCVPPDPAAIDTASKELRDGLNPCPRCGSTEVRHRPGSDRLICLYCRHEWAATRVEEAFGLGEGLSSEAQARLVRGLEVASAWLAQRRRIHQFIPKATCRPPRRPVCPSSLCRLTNQIREPARELPRYCQRPVKDLSGCGPNGPALAGSCGK